MDIGGRRLHINCLGEGTPTVVLEAGGGGTSLDWSLVQPALSKTMRVCACDRAGAGWSDPGPLPRTLQSVVDDLSALLEAANVPGPYLLVTHSDSGLATHLFAIEYGYCLRHCFVDARTQDSFTDGEGQVQLDRARVLSTITTVLCALRSRAAVWFRPVFANTSGGSSPGVSYPRVVLFSWPAIGAIGVAGLVCIWFSHRTGFPAAWDTRISNSQRLIHPAVLGIGPGLIESGLDLVFHWTQFFAQFSNLTAFNAPWPGSLLFYPGGAILVEVFYRLLPVPLLLFDAHIVGGAGGVAHAAGDFIYGERRLA